MTPPRFRIGVNLGTTTTEASVVRLGLEPEVVAHARVPTNRSLGYEHIVSGTRGLILTVARDAGVDALQTPIGVAMPGSVTTRRADGSRSEVPLVKSSNTTFSGRPFRDDLMRAIGCPVAFANDANCFALAEATWGAAREARVTFGVIIGNGVGGGLVIRELGVSGGGVPSMWNGGQGIAGEWGHVVLESELGPECYCGKRGCVEAYLSGPSLEAEYKKRGGSGSQKLVDIAERASSGEDVIARKLIADRIDVFGRALATVINIVDPDVIVLGGGVSNIPALYDKGPRAIARWVFNDDPTTKLVKHALGDNAVVLGAALLPPSVAAG